MERLLLEQERQLEQEQQLEPEPEQLVTVWEPQERP